jgi:hypothetical protein
MKLGFLAADMRRLILPSTKVSRACFQNKNVDMRFPLTPALSLGEREKRPQFFGQAMAAFCSGADNNIKGTQRLFPLPGERVRVRGKRAPL